MRGRTASSSPRTGRGAWRLTGVTFGSFGGPNQGVYDPWIAKLRDHLVPELAGSVNLSAPEPLPNAEFMRTLRTAWGMPVGLPASRWMLELGAAVLRTETELVLKSRRVVPGRLLKSGFAFEFPSWSAAAADLCRRWRTGRVGAA